MQWRPEVRSKDDYFVYVGLYDGDGTRVSGQNTCWVLNERYKALRYANMLNKANGLELYTPELEERS